jgi:endonuclease/exonuclease/phosphatase (EEP) superfamily protein YafD
LSRVVRAVIVAALIGSVALTAAYAIGPERFWLVALTQYAPYPVYAVPLLGVLALSLILGWRWRLSAALGVMLVMVCVAGFEFHPGASADRQLRVMTFNIKDYVTLRHPGGLQEISSEISRQDPDILVLQDARAVMRIGATSRAQHALFGERQIFSYGQYVIASRFPLRDCNHGEITFRQQPHSYIHCVVVFGTNEFDVVTAHFITPRFGLNATREDPWRGISQWRENVADRMTQATQLAADLRVRTRPLLVAGDLNAPATSLVVRTLLDTGLRDAFSVAGVGFGHTWGHSLRFGLSFLRIDHILVSPEFHVDNCFVGGTASAHRPVVADLHIDGLQTR